MSSPIKYPVLIPSKGRAETLKTAGLLLSDDIPCIVVVEPQEREAYAKALGADRVVAMPEPGRGTATPARNFCKEYARDVLKSVRHWQMDDNIRAFRIWTTGKGVKCTPREALLYTEHLVDSFTNVGIAGLRHGQFNSSISEDYLVNKQVCYCVLVDNRTPARWRGSTAHDTDYSLQILASGLCTINVSLYTVDKVATMSMKGGHTDVAYSGDNRVHAARALQRRWPFMFKVDRRGELCRHVHAGNIWSKFTTKLIPVQE